MVPMSPTPVELPFRAGLNPHTDACGRRLDEWARRTGASAAVSAWAGYRLGPLAGRLFPTASPAVLDLTGRYLTWLCVYDDHFDPGSQGDRLPYASAVARDVVNMLRGAPPPPDEQLVVALLRYWRDDVVGVASPEWWRRCVVDLAQVARGITDEVGARARGGTPDVEAYLAHRRRSMGITVLTNLMELAEHLEVPDDLRVRYRFQDLRSAVLDMASVGNDLISLRKEVRAGESHNLVLLMCRTRGCDVVEGEKIVRDWLARMVVDYLALKGELRLSLPAAEAEVVTRYAGGLETMLRGMVDWGMETSRYR
ncbi:terpene synthase family protein [Actinokineospora sp. G85]|uniref:terpene synthase family protein n=1 Tax=Actinokineospora sp. G85 TaxID=3406626 RepID=UPI003C734168